MGVFGKLQVIMSDDPRYPNGSVVDLFLDTPQTPAPAAFATGTLPVDETQGIDTTNES